ncbi:hypothetical protein HOP50_01g02540 [Chloropicon primus]|uniref:Uncharacterized protein n=1 Tax=Chloropicon primus TaxID=1764295 RepID=A0A5B8MDP1_9CHLO|nr:hypothetical protein A3770_01p02630 [Chloropicon primus]UPQ96963.1 hypothetical protein HOP50_01g02540 [Chloropicon primus]|eukprot:QDZ17745.1 hypothetical protein A3770_01p02630 [Chloropicon primus]
MGLHTPKIRVKYGDLSLLRETGEYLPPPALATYTASLTRRIVPSPPRGRLRLDDNGDVPSRKSSHRDEMGNRVGTSGASTLDNSGLGKSKTRSGASRSLFEEDRELFSVAGEVREEGTSSERIQRKEGKLGVGDESARTDAVGGLESKKTEWNGGGRAYDRSCSPVERGPSEREGEGGEVVEGGASDQSPAAEAGSDQTQAQTQTRGPFGGFARSRRDWFDESGYSGCLDRLEELEEIVEAQFKDLSTKGYAVPPVGSTTLDGETLSLRRGSPLKLETLEKLEKTVEKQHKDLIQKGVLPGDSLRIFTS